MDYATAADLEDGLSVIRNSPREVGRVELIVRRPAVGSRELLDVGVIDESEGLVGDSWRTRPSGDTADGSAHPDKKLTLMNARAARLVAGDTDRWALAGDQLYIDFDLSVANAPAGTRLSLGSAIVEVTDKPHLGCAKFAARFGPEALRWVNSPAGRELRLRGVNAKVVTGGAVKVGDVITAL